MFNQEYDVIVVGGGHAGSEAAAAAANLGAKTLLVTMNLQTIGQMSCNPAMGGIAKGQIVREIDAIGGYSGIVTDKSSIQFKMLNLSKGPAMWSPRAQNDRALFAQYWREMLESTPNLDFYQEMVKKLWIEKNKLFGVVTGLGQKIKGKTVVLTNGTFLNGLIHVGPNNFDQKTFSELLINYIGPYTAEMQRDLHPYDEYTSEEISFESNCLPYSIKRRKQRKE